MRAAIGLGLLLPALVAAQAAPVALAPGIESLLAEPEVDEFLEGLDSRFIEAFLILVPDLPMEDQLVLADAAETAFGPEAVRSYLAVKIGSQASADQVARLIEMRETGAQAEVGRIAASYIPTQSLDDFTANLDAEERGRLQLMARLAEAEGWGDLDLLTDEAARRSAHELLAALGGDTPYQPLSDEDYDAVYRQRILSRALELLHTLEPVPDDLIAAAIVEFDSDPAQWYVNAFAGGVLEAVQSAGRRVLGLTASADQPEPEPELDPADAGMPCRARACGFLLEWQGRTPTDFNRRFGASGDLEVRVLERLVGAGYRLERGILGDGVTMRLRARTMIGLCDALSGTDNTGCTAIDQVRVEFVGTDPAFEQPSGFTIRNRCGADSAMDVNGFAALVALRLHYELTTYPGDERQVPNC